MRAARSEGSSLNRATLGTFGKEAQTMSEQNPSADAVEN